ncbi:MAG: hypothetical protein R3Y08_03280 [Rikenellaceae bacterium]
MNIQEIRHEIEELLLLVKGWEHDGALTLIESDIALVKLSRLYERIRFLSSQSPLAVTLQKESEAIAPVEEESVSEYYSEERKGSIFAIDLDEVTLHSHEEEGSQQQTEVIETNREQEEEILLQEEAPVVQEEEIAVANKEEVIVQEEVAAQQEEEIETNYVEPTSATSTHDNVLFAMEPIKPRQSRRRRSVLMSLYNDDAQQQYTTQAERGLKESISSTRQQGKDSSKRGVATMFDEPVLTLADTLNTDMETVADRLATESSHTLVSDKLACSSFEELGINERYLLARDLFEEDAQQCDQVLATIGAFEDYDDALIHIVENYNWNPEAEGTKLLLSILENKFNIR